MAAEMMFETRAAFRAWLLKNHQVDDGMWLIFGKAGGPTTVSPDEALEEALCFGWIDGQLNKIDETRYRKYFAPRRKQSPWSAKNIALAEKLEKDGLMTDAGRARIEEAKRDGRFVARARLEITHADIDALAERIRGNEPAYTNFMAMSPSVKKSYTGLSMDVKSEEARARRLEKIIARLNDNLKPM